MKRPIGLNILGLLALALGSCGRDAAQVGDPPSDEFEPFDPPVAVIRVSSLRWEGEQAFINLYAGGTASGLVVINFDEGLLYGTSIPDSWTWLAADTVEVCSSVAILRNEVGFPPMERDCGTFPVTGKELDQDGDGEIDFVETFTILHSDFLRGRPGK